MTDDEPRGEPLARFEIDEATGRRQQWELSLFADHLELESPAGKVHRVLWADRHERIQTLDRLHIRRVLVVTLKQKKAIFRLEPDAFAAVQAWIGPPTPEDLKVALKHQFAWALPLGIVFVLSALPLAELPFDPVSFGLGLGLILTSTLSRVRPHRVFFALESLWFCSLAANSIWRLVGDWAWLQALFLALQMLLAWRAIQEYHRFGPGRMAEAGEGGAETD
ncbi:MAG: hypothetical protein J2P46_01710 [Zavarzinella sp.]|nr:hypothetical protein [Zavarzinella sp.]